MKEDRLERLRILAERHADEAERALGTAREEFAAAEAELAAATEALELSTSSWVDATSIYELSDADDKRISLAKRLSRARDRTASAAAEVETRRLVLVEKRITEKRFELLIENGRRSATFQVVKAERRANDELAARWRAAR